MGSLLMLWIILCVPAFADAAGAIPDARTCHTCHSETQYLEGFVSSVHGTNNCLSCHPELSDLAEHPLEPTSSSRVVCEGCHKQVAAAYSSSIHLAAGVGCSDCHIELHTRKRWQGEKQIALKTCLMCHPLEEYRQSVHGRAIAAGNADSAACHDCHGLHNVQAVSDLSTDQIQAFNTDTCLVCHNDAKKMTRNLVTTEVVPSFMTSLHGKSYRLGSTRRAAGCADCHGAHRILASSDPASSLYPGNRVVTCAKCHPDATPSFTRFYAHGNPSDRSKYPFLYWTFLGMTSLLVAVFTLFWIHSLLWMYRGFVENRQKLAAQARGEGVLVPSAHKQYLRFPRRYVFFHLIVIVSFLGLSLTGLPLKFSDQDWARVMISFYGGVEYAGLLHRACAVLTFYYFVAALLMSAEFLFNGKKGERSWLQRLFGPDSLMPNFKDWQDLKGMLRWFLFKGPKPEFERWSYWEKFDFMAVFWGMFAIGGSGLLLWFPEFFGQFLPGWIFNVALIIHSDEALLATGFIFTVHFFNTHGRPEKFPMDFVIFNGQISRQEFIEERGAQWQRYQDAGITEQFEAKKTSSVLYDFIFKGFGFLALFTGLALAFLMLIAFATG